MPLNLTHWGFKPRMASYSISKIMRIAQLGFSEQLAILATWLATLFPFLGVEWATRSTIHASDDRSADASLNSISKQPHNFLNQLNTPHPAALRCLNGCWTSLEFSHNICPKLSLLAQCAMNHSLLFNDCYCSFLNLVKSQNQTKQYIHWYVVDLWFSILKHIGI